mgnify:CR=1 FL=1
MRNSVLNNDILDQKDRKILMLLQENGRESMTNISKKVGLSIDAVNNRVKTLLKKEIFYTGIFISRFAPRISGEPGSYKKN